MKVNVKKLCERIIVCIIVASIGLTPVSAKAQTNADEIIVSESDTLTDQSENICSEDENHTEPPVIDNETESKQPETDNETESEQPNNQVLIHDGYQYILENDEVTIVKESSTLSEDTVPSEINGYPVVAIGAYAYSGVYLDHSFTIPESVKVIEDNAFEGAQINGGLYIFPELEEIGKDAFKDATIDGVYFMGEKSKFNDIKIGEGNESLLNADINDKFDISRIMFKNAVSTAFGGLAEFPGNVVSSLEGYVLFLIPPLNIIGLIFAAAPTILAWNSLSTSWSYFEASIAVLFI